MARTRRLQFHYRPFRTTFLTLLLIACVSGTAIASKKAERLYLLAGTPIDNDPASYPVTLYTVGPDARPERVRRIFSKKQGLFGVRDDFECRLYAMSESQDILSVIHESNPERVDTVKGNLTGKYGMYGPAWGVVAPPGQGSSMIFPDTYAGAKPWKVVTVAGNPTVSPRISEGKWSLYRWFRYRGAPVVPWFEMVSIPAANILNHQIMMPVQGVPPGDRIIRGKLVRGPVLSGTVGVVGDTPPNLPPIVGTHMEATSDAWGTVRYSIRTVVIVADTPRFFVFAAPPFHSKQWPVPVYVQNKATGRWSMIDSPFIKLWPRIFGPWLATTVNEPNPTGRKSPGVENERYVPGYAWSTSQLPDIRNELGYWAGPHGIVSIFMPAKLLLQNLVDGRKLTIDTGQQDSEVLDVRKDGLVLYRVNNEIFSAHIEGDKLSAPKLVVKGEDVPEVHWVFWSKALTEPYATAQSSAKH